MAPKPLIAVMGPDNASGNLAQAEELGKAIAQAGFITLTGGRSRGVMDAACKGAKEAGGTTIGIIPADNMSDVSPYVDIPILTGMGSGRNNINALSASVMIAIGMGPGTASEVSLAIKNHKNVVLLGATEEATKFFTSLAPSQVHTAANVDAALAHVRSLLAADKQ